MKLLNGPMVQWSNMIWSMCDKMARRGPSHLRNAYSMHGIWSKKLEGLKGGRTTKTRLMSRKLPSRECSTKWTHHRSKSISRQLFSRKQCKKKVWTRTDVYRLYGHWAWFQPIPKLGFFWNQQWILCGFHLSTGDDFMDVPWQQIERVPSGNLLHSELENGHLVRWFTQWKWWFSIVMLVYQRVVDKPKKNGTKRESVRTSLGGPVFGAHPSSNRPVGRQHFLQRQSGVHVFSQITLQATSQMQWWKLSGVISTTYPLRKPPGAENLETKRAQILIPSGKRLHNYGKSPFLTGKSTKFLWPFSSSS